MTSTYRTHPPHTTTLPATWAELRIIRGEARNKVRRISTPAYLMGRADDCDLILSDQQFPEVHACILLRRGGVFLRHLGFMPEITVNGTLVTRAQLADGDRIRTGPYEFRVHLCGPRGGGQPLVETSPVHFAEGEVTAEPSPPSASETMAMRQVRHLLVAVRQHLLTDLGRMRIYSAPKPNPAAAARSIRLPASSVPMARPA